MCVNLKDAEWITLPYGAPDRDRDGKPARFIGLNYHTVLQGPQTNNMNRWRPVATPNSIVPSSLYGSSPFLIKIQFAANQPMMIYDRTREFQTAVSKGDCSPQVWKQIEDTCKAKGYWGAKLYVWAKRMADKEFAITLNHLPDQNSIPW